MLFRKKRRMIDVRTFHRGGVVSIPKEKIEIPQNTSGYIDISKTGPTRQKSTPPSNANFFNFMGNSSNTSSASSNQFSSEAEGYSKREVDAKITELDNKIYRLEQRVELLEKKAGVSSSSNTSSSGGLIGW